MGFLIKNRIRRIKRQIISHKGKELQNLLFLDVDGVLCPTSYLDIYSYSKTAIEFVNSLAEEYGLIIVFISSRRLYPEIWKQTQRSLLQAGLKEKYITCDPDPGWLSEDHSEAVLNYLNNHVCKIFVIVDDTDFYSGTSSLDLFHIKPDPVCGFSEIDFEKVKKKLNSFDNILAVWK